MALKLTPSGTDLLLRAIAGEVNIKFTAIQLGNGADAGKSAAALSNPLLTAEISSYEVGDVFVTLRTTFSNSQVSASFRATEVGVLAHDPDTADGTLLYAYQYTPEGESDYIPASTDKVLETQMDVLVYIGDAQNVTASISESLVYASKAELEAHEQDTGNPHKVTKEQIGLGNVSNVAVNDQTPTYTIAGTLTALVSGERLSAAFGKLARAVSSLISHLADKENPHGVTASQVGAAASSHKHSTADITSGVLGTARGGLGNTSGQAASAVKLTTARTIRVNLASGAAESFNGTSNVTPGVTGVLPVNQGGTGVTGYDRLKEKLGVNCKIERVRSNYRTLDRNNVPGGGGNIDGRRNEKNRAAFGNDTFVAIGDKALFDHTPIVYVSNNGVIYDKVDVDLPTNEFLNGLVFGGGLFVGVFQSKVIYSEDGRSWTTVSLDKKYEGARICFGIDTFMIVPAAKGVNVCYTSKDAVTWTAHNMPSVPGEGNYFGLCYGDGKFVAITDHEITVSNDKGETWSDLKPVSGFQNAGQIIYGHGKYIIITEPFAYKAAKHIAISKDLSTWVALYGSDDNWYPESIGITNTGFCASAEMKDKDGYLRTHYYSSEDGYTWNRSSEDFGGTSGDFLHAKGITWDFARGGSVMASSDGDSWTDVFYKLSDGSIITIGPMKGE